MEKYTTGGYFWQILLRIALVALKGILTPDSLKFRGKKA